MSAPYSDNLYSGDLSDDEQDALSPVDGYFHASSNSNPSSPSPAHPPPTSSNVPSVPNVLVEDPTLRDQGAAKAREAEEERLNNASDPLSPQPQPHPHPPSSHTPSTSEAPSSSHYQSQSQYQQPSTHTSPPTSPTHHHRRSVEEDEPIHFAGHTRPAVSLPFARNVDAPPAYSPSSPPPGQSSAGYQTFAPVEPAQTAPTAAAAMGVPEEQQRLLPREPESMGGPPDGQKPTSRWQRFWSSINGPNMRKKLKTLLGVLVILSIFFVLFSSFTLRPTHEDPDIIDPAPVKRPKDPKMDHGDLVWQPMGSCLDKAHKMSPVSNTVNFRSGHNLTFIETDDSKRNDHRNGWNPNVFGEVIISPSSGTSPALIKLDVITNDEDLLPVNVEFDDGKQIFKVITPRNIEWPHTNGNPCIQMRAVIEVPHSSLIDYFKVESVHLDLLIEEGLVMGALYDTKLLSVVGDVVAPAVKKEDKDVVPYTLSSRDITIETISGDVSGWYPLYDLLKVHTASGDVKINIGPKAVDNANPRSADLEVSSASGQLKLYEPIDDALKASKPDKKFPPRDYVVNLSTASGDISGDLAVSSVAKIESRSGDLNLRLWPVLDSTLLKMAATPKPNIRTDTSSGDTSIELLDPLWTSSVRVGDAPSAPPGPPAPPAERAPEWDDHHDFIPIGDDDPYLIIHPHEQDSTSEVEMIGDAAADDFSARDTPAFSVLKSRHDSISGNIKLVYPSTWEGSLWAQTISGSQKIRGDDLEVNRSGGSYMRTTTGRKGSGYSELKVDTVSGDQDVLIGKESEKSK